MPTAIEEQRCTDAAPAMAGLVGRERPLILRGAVRDWPVVAGLPSSPRSPGQGFAHLYYLLEAALAGLGIAIAPASLGAGERAGWRELLDYYVFGEVDPAAHIPAPRRGMLGAHTPEQAAAVRETIKRYL